MCCAQVGPQPIPDVCVGAPVVVSGKLAGEVPLHMELRGVRADGAPWKARVPLQDAASLPLSVVSSRAKKDKSIEGLEE